MPGTPAAALRPVAVVVGRMLSGALAVVLAATMLVPLVGMKALSVRSGSMEPTIGVGDVVVDRMVTPDVLRTGDVVTFVDPASPVGRLITHRVQSVAGVAGTRYHVVTRGDANDTSEQWAIDADGTVGLVEYRVPRLGYALNALSTRSGRLAVVALLVVLGLWLLALIWQEPDRTGNADHAGAPTTARPPGALRTASARLVRRGPDPLTPEAAASLVGRSVGELLGVNFVAP